MEETTRARFVHWFWQPPRPHGQTIADRRVSPLELLYDLIYVALIAEAADPLAATPSVVTLIGFTIIAALIWLAWLNGSLYLELHGRSDGRTRSYVFVQMGILALLAVFTADATGGTGAPFAALYTAFLVVLTWLWYTVRRQDRPEFMEITARYLVAMIATSVAIGVSVLVPEDARLAIWAISAVAWFAFFLWMAWAPGFGFGRGIIATDSMVERFGLVTIIVLGELVLSVVEGLSDAAKDLLTLLTGVLALGLGFGFWWLYFDIIGGRLPRQEGRALTGWILIHFPIALAIAVTGAATVSLIEHAHDPSTPRATAWLISAAVATVLVAMSVATLTLVDAARMRSVYRRLATALVLGAIAAIALALIRQPPWSMALGLAVVMSTLWLYTARSFIAAGIWRGEAAPDHSPLGTDHPVQEGPI